MNWQLDSWRQFQTLQQPKYPDLTSANITFESLQTAPPIVSVSEIQDLSNHVLQAELGNQMILQIGDCAETFDESTEQHIQAKHDLYMKCKSIFSSYAKYCIIVGRIAGQYAKPRTEEYEKIDGQLVYSYYGDSINSYEKNKRMPNHENAIIAYKTSKQTYSFLKSISENQQFYICHEGLLLDYEQSLTRYDSSLAQYYCQSAHMLWIGERTRGLDQGHVQFFKGISNPIGVKISSTVTENYLVSLLNELNPQNHKGKIAIIVRGGAQNIKQTMENLIKWKKQYNLNFSWICDPMHGNTKKNNSFKIRIIEDILQEMKVFVEQLKFNQEIIAGLHIEATPSNVLECLTEQQVKKQTEVVSLSKCDPRLNQEQCFMVVEKFLKLISQ